MAKQFVQRNGKTAVQQLFAKYVEEIREKIIAEHGPSYMTVAEVGNKWRDQIAYKKEAEQFLIEQTKLFIRMLDKKVPAYTNPKFLEAFVNEAVDYLSRYTMRGSGLVRNQEKHALKRELWNTNAYIQGMIAFQKEKNAQPRTQKAIRERKHNQRKEEAKQAHLLTIQVKLEFNDARKLKVR